MPGGRMKIKSKALSLVRIYFMHLESNFLHIRWDQGNKCGVK